MSVELPAWAMWLDVPVTTRRETVRHRVLYGGRGGAKSWTIALKLLQRARSRKLRILCVREFQNSIRDSSKRLLEDCIDRLRFGASGDGFFTITERDIRGRNGSVITFVGLNGKDAAIKSYEGVDIVWVEEAASVTQSSIDALVPTIRRPGSEIWWSYNPRYPTDPVDRLFRGDNRPPGTIIVEVHGRDNPWFPPVLARDRDYDLSRDPEKHKHVWEGGYVQRSEASVFKNWTVHTFEAPDDALHRFGADWGYSVDPTVLVRCFIGRWDGEPGSINVIADPDGKELFIDYEAYEIGCTIDNTPALFAGSDKRFPPRWPNPFAQAGIPGAARTRITADSARPETIAHMRHRGFDITAAIKGKQSVDDGIEFLKSYNIVVHPRCRHLIDEMTHYSWKIDKLTGDILPQLADTNNHVIDALRYALEGARRARSPKQVIATAGPRIMQPGWQPIMGPDPGADFCKPDWMRRR